MAKTTPTFTTTETNVVPAEQLETDRGTGGDVLVGLMREAGVEVAFGVVSIHNIPLVEAVDRDLRFVPVRHEAAAINAADAYARATGKFGVALTSTGTGAGNAAGASLEALNAHSRVLHITGNIDSTFLGEDRLVYHEVPRQLEMLRAVSAHAVRVEKARHARRTLLEAIHLLDTAPFGPVSVDWPIDLQYTADPGKQNKAKTAPPKPVKPTKKDVAAAIKVMRRAKRPLIWAGGGSTGVGFPLQQLAEAWGAGVLTGGKGRGAIPEKHPLYIGNFPLAAEISELVERADCLLTVGSHLRGNETGNFTLALPDKHVQIDLEADTIGTNHPATVAIAADAELTVPELLDALGRVTTDPEWAIEVKDATDAAIATHRGQIGAYAEICDSLNERLPRGTVMVRDVTIPGNSWGNRLLRIDEPRCNVFAAGGGIGQGLAMAVGAGVAHPQGTVLGIVGDGGVAVHLGELGTLAQEAPHVVLTIFNDGGYGILRNMQDAKDGPRRAVDLRAPDFGKLAEAYGLPFARVGDVAAFDAALAAAVDREGPSVIEVDVTALHPQPDPIVPAVQVP